MKEAVSFLMEMILVSCTFYFGYRLIFRHTSATFRRWYLLAWLMFSIAFPLVSIEIPSGSPVSVSDLVKDSVPVFQDEFETGNSPIIPSPAVENPASDLRAEPPTEINWGLIGIIGYILISLIFLLRIALGFYQILRLKKNAVPLGYHGRKVFEVQNSSFRGASFFRWVFIGKNIERDREMVLDHEFVHCDLRHSFDILFSHLNCAFFWINPLSWILRKNIAVNTELEADACLIKVQDKKDYASLLLDLSQTSSETPIMNHFSAKHLKMRIKAMKNVQSNRKWVPVFSIGMTLGIFFLISCSNGDFSSEISSEERLNDVKTITTYFTSHQSDTQQKNGKIVSIARFLPNGDLDELVNKTSYPYDHEFEKKKSFWTQPIRKNLPFVMDGLTVGLSERNLLYGNNWPASYARYLLDREAREEVRMPWKETYEIDDLDKPTTIKTINVMDKDVRFSFFHNIADATTFYEYEGEKLTRTSIALYYPEREMSEPQKQLYENFKKQLGDEEVKKMKEKLANEGKKKTIATYSYDGELLTEIVHGDYNYKFYYERDRLSKSEYYIRGRLINTRAHFYEDGLHQRTELYNIDGEAEYTITYEYEFWE